MELTPQAIRTPEDLEKLEFICPPVNSGHPSLAYFSDYIESPNNFTTHFHFSSNDDVVIVGELQEKELVSNPRSFVNSIYSSNLSNSMESYFSYIIDFYKRKNITTIRFHSSPGYIQKSPKLVIDSKMEYRCTTSVIKVDNYQPSSRRVRSIKKAKANGYEIEITKPEDYFEVWSFLRNFLASKKLPILTFDRVLQLVTKFPMLFSLIRVNDSDGELIAAALANRIGDCIRLPNYCGSKMHYGATDFLISKVVEMAVNQKIQYVDLGTSTDPKTGLEIEGIVNYKSEFSAIRYVLEDEVLTL